MESTIEVILNFVQPFIVQYPVLTKVALVLYFIGLVLKPLLAFAKAIVDITPMVKDNEKLEKVVDSKAYKIIAYCLDWFVRLKLPKK